MRLSVGAVGARVLRSRAARAPIWLYRHHLGGLLGGRVLLLEHVGRRSGRTRFVCLEVVERPRPGVLTVVSGFGAHAQWYRNLQQHPSCTVQVGATRRQARAHFQDAAASVATLDRYAHDHPRAWRRLRTVLLETSAPSGGLVPAVDLELVPTNP